MALSMPTMHWATKISPMCPSAIRPQGQSRINARLDFYLSTQRPLGLNLNLKKTFL